MDGGIDFGDRQPLPGHFSVRLDIPDNLPERFRRPADYISTAVNRQFELVHSFSHEKCIVLITADQTLVARIRQFTSELMATMAQTTKTFLLRVKGVAALSKPLVAELASRLGELIDVKMNGSTVDDYAETAFISVRQAVDWRCPSTLKFRAYGLNLEAKLAVTTDGPAAPDNANRNSATGGRAAGDGWQVARAKPRVAKAELCRDFARGVCSRGDACIFRHSGRKAEGNGSGVIYAEGAIKKAKSTDPCRDFRRGQCARDQCKFVHAGDSKIPRKTPVNDGGHRAGSPTALGPSRSGPVQTSLRPHAPASSPPPPPSAPTSPRPRQRRRGGSSDDDMDDTPPDSPAISPRPSRTRSRSWPADEAPNPATPRSAWLKPLAPSTLVAPTPVLGKKRPLAQTPPPPPAAQHAAPLVGAGPRAP